MLWPFYKHSSVSALLSTGREKPPTHSSCLPGLCQGLAFLWVVPSSEIEPGFDHIVPSCHLRFRWAIVYSCRVQHNSLKLEKTKQQKQKKPHTGSGFVFIFIYWVVKGITLYAEQQEIDQLFKHWAGSPTVVVSVCLG